MKKFIAKVVLLGEGAVGKTSLKRRFMEGTFDPSEQMTIGADFSRIVLDISDDIKVILQVFDIAGQARFSEIAPNYYEGAKGAIVIFDVTREETFMAVQNWISILLKYTKQKIPIVLVGNKIDLEDQIVVTENRAQEYAKILSDWLGYPVPYMQTSALKNINVNESFYTLTNNMLDYIFKKK